MAFFLLGGGGGGGGVGGSFFGGGGGVGGGGGGGGWVFFFFLFWVLVALAMIGHDRARFPTRRGRRVRRMTGDHGQAYRPEIDGTALTRSDAMGLLTTPV